MPIDHDEPTDRRVLRGQRNRAAVVNALIELINEGDITPTAAEVAERAGVSLRSIYHHFSDIEGLQMAMAEQIFSGLIELLTPLPTDGPLDFRLGAFVAERAVLYEQAMPAFRASRANAVTNAAVAKQIALGHRFLRTECEQTFATELESAPGWRVEAVDAAASIDGWVRLRIHQKLSIEVAREVLANTVRLILTDTLD